ncbi:pentapeptide repeat-containing protein [Clostridium sp. UBA871]|uniref:pentapeptide repeat-containing protein n=1 Tax=Clostridium sp. UBA871 TaxID=1946380 RepID=UPI00321629F8
MPYINFKEEVFKGKEELYKRIENNKKLFSEIKNNKNKISIQQDEKYSFRIIKDRTINNSKTENEGDFLEITDKSIVCTEFIKCKFYNIKFKNCTFMACRFIECDFGGGGVIFENCTMILEEINNVPSLNKKDNLSCSFEKCKLYCKFLSSNITYLIIDECELKDTSFELTDMTSAIIINSYMKRINLMDVDLSGGKIISTYIEDLEFNDKLKSKLDPKTFFDKIQPKKKTKTEYEGIYTVYETIADKYNENNLKNNFGEYYYLCKNMQRKSLKKLLPKTISYIYWFTCGYGERILYPLISSLVLILIFATMYLILGYNSQNQIISYWWSIGLPKNFNEFLSQVNQCINISVEVFTGLGSDNETPIPASFIVANTEMIVGVIMMGVGIGTLTRKLVR